MLYRLPLIMMMIMRPISDPISTVPRVATTQTMFHIVDSCPSTKLDGGLSDSTLQMTKQSTGWQSLERWTANKRRRRHVISIEKQTSPFPSSSGSAIIVPDPQMSIPALTVRYFHGKDIVCGPKTFASNYNRSQNHAAKPTPNVKSSQCISDKIFVLLYIIVFWLLTFLFFVKW